MTFFWIPSLENSNEKRLSHVLLPTWVKKIFCAHRVKYFCQLFLRFDWIDLNFLSFVLQFQLIFFLRFTKNSYVKAYMPSELLIYRHISILNHQNYLYIGIYLLNHQNHLYTGRHAFLIITFQSLQSQSLLYRHICLLKYQNHLYIGI